MSRAKLLIVSTAAALGLMAGLSACGSSSSDGEKKTTTTEAASGGDEATTTAADDDTTTTEDDDDTSTTVVATGGGEFCDDLAAYINDASMADIDVTDPAAYEASIKESTEKSKDLLDKAPDELDDSVEVLVDFQDNLVTELEKVGFDYTKLPPDALGSMNDPELTAANQELTTYVEDTCGIDLPDAPTVDAPEISTETVAPAAN